MSIDYVVAETHTSTLSGPERSDFWREHVRLNQGSLDFDFGRLEEFDGSTIVQRHGGHQVIEFWSDPVAYTRRPWHALREDDRSLRVVVPRSGSVSVERPDDVVVVEAGWAAVLSMTSSFTVRHDETTRAWILNIPEDEWFHPFPAAQTVALDLRVGAGRVTSSLVEALSEQRASLSVVEFHEISTRVSDLLNLTFGRSGGPSHGRLGTVERAARDLVRRQSDDPALTPATLAECLGWSLRQVQAALAEAGTTPSALIRGHRLSRAHARLTAASGVARTIGEIAHDSGFGSLSGFNLAFREEYGASARTVRAAALLDRGHGDRSPAGGVR